MDTCVPEPCHKLCPVKDFSHRTSRFLPNEANFRFLTPGAKNVSDMFVPVLLAAQHAKDTIIQHVAGATNDRSLAAMGTSRPE